MIDPLTDFYIEERENTVALEDLRTEVVKILVSTHDFLIEDAEATAEESIKANPGMWNENADAGDLANYLASDDDES